ncbi:MAG TPA: PolC-type DNA polymerase III [Bacilli bacterium]|nr:PolC-type DNA polymerase III [Bacilli bacterium]
MHDKLKLLLEQINMPNELYSYFDDGKLDKICVVKSDNKVKFLITLSKVLPVSTYVKFNNLLNNHFNMYDNSYPIFTITDYKDNELLKEYYEYFISEYCVDSPLLEVFVGVPINIKDDTIEIELCNKAEIMKFNTIKDKLIEDLKNIGFAVKINLIINEEASNAIKNKIEEEKRKQAEALLEKEQEKQRLIKGREITSDARPISEISYEGDNITIEAKIFGIDSRETPKINILTLKVTDETDSIFCKVFERDNEKYKQLIKNIKEGTWYKIKGKVQDDLYSKELVMMANDIMRVDHSDSKAIKDDAEVKRVELHAHTKMSQMDGVADEVSLVKQAIAWGHRGIGITDHNGCQAFPHVFSTVTDYNKKIEKEEDKFKAVYGTEISIIEDRVNIIVRPNDSLINDNIYVVFDTETTGFNAGLGDQMIEIGAVKMKDGEVIERFDELIDPNRPIDPEITEVTQITNAMLKGKASEEEVTKRFKEFIKDYPLVAHNAKFDISMIEMAYYKYNLGEFTNPVIDTLELSRTMDREYSKHSLSALVKRYGVPFDEEHHHRADYDAEGTGYIFNKMRKKMLDMGLVTLNDIQTLCKEEEIHKFGREYHTNLLALNKTGLKNMFKIISYANAVYISKTPRIPKHIVDELREGILVGSCCYKSEVFDAACSKTEEQLKDIINFYDYVEVQPPEVYEHLVWSHELSNNKQVEECIKKIVKCTKEQNKIIIASGDVHHLKRDDKIYREFIVNQKVPGGGRHPLARVLDKYMKIPSQHFRTTNEMLNDFNFLGKDLAKEIVIDNTNKIVDMVEIIEVIIDTGGVPFSPIIEKSVETVTSLVYNKAKDWYGEPLPINIEERIAKELYGDSLYESIKQDMIEQGIKEDENFTKEIFSRVHDAILKSKEEVENIVRENIKKNSEEELTEKDLEKKLKKSLGGIIGGGFDVIYLIAQKLVKHSNDDGYLVGSRGSVGSSFVATMMGITEVNPLPAHYRCLKCKHSIFDDESGNPLGATYSSGFDLPDLECPHCKERLHKDGQDMPFATFLGFNADKVPDIDLNFSDLNQAAAHEYTKVLFGVDNVYRAGTIGTVADKTAYGFVKGFYEDRGIMKRSAEIERLAIGCTGVKRTTGQHPGGIVVIPGYMDVFDFTPYQFPADDPMSAWRTTHFDYHAIDQDVLKLDILGHSDPTQLRMIQDLTKMDVTTVPLDDKETMNIFLSPEPLGVTKEQIMCETGTLGIPEFGTPFTIGMLVDTKPKTFSELIKISGLSHGTDVWLGNAQELIRNNVVPFKDVIGCRDDIMVYLMYNGLKPIKAFKIMEFVRKGKASKDPATWSEHVATMREAGIEEWFIDSCSKIKYMFPKAHAAAYVISAFRIAYYKVHMPAVYYASYLTSRITDYDIETMIKGYTAIRNKIVEISNKGYDATNKENSVLDTLKIALEATARNIKFANIDITRSKADEFVILDDHTLLPPFSTIDGLGGTVAMKIIEEREKKPFISIEDFQKRGKVSQTLIDKMRVMGILNGMDESSQLSLF